MRSRVLMMTTIAVVLVGCRGDTAAPDTTIPADLPPGELVEALLAAVEEGRFDQAAALTDNDQAALLALAEGADANDVLEALSEDPEGVGANFWSGFAQSLAPESNLSEASISVGEEVVIGEERFVPVEVTDGRGETRTYYLRQDEGWKLDLMATFGHVMASRLTPTVETLLASANTNARSVVALLNDSADSLQVAAQDPSLDASTYQALLALLERVTRVG